MNKRDIFISYSRKDTAIADRICQAFDKAGITYFIDRQGIAGGMEFPKVLAEAILNCKIFLYLGSENSYGSKFTNSEVTYAFNKKQKEQILPYIIDNSSLPTELEFVFSCINIRNIKEHPIETILIQDILQILGKHTEKKTTKKPRNKKNLLLGLMAGCIAIGITAIIYFISSEPAKEEHSNYTEQQTAEEQTAEEQAEESTSKFKDPDFIFNTDEEVRSFLSGKAFKSPQGLWFAFNESLTMEIWEEGAKDGRKIKEFIVKDIKGDSATLEITYDIIMYNGQYTKFINILECNDGTVSININGGGYKYYCIQ